MREDWIFHERVRLPIDHFRRRAMIFAARAFL